LCSAVDAIVVRMVERELCEYPRLRERLRRIEDDIIMSSPLPPTVEPARRGRGKGRYADPTGTAAVRLVIAKQRIEHRIRRVERALMAMSRRQRLFVELRYFRGASQGDVMRAMSISRATYYRLRLGAILAFATVAGWGCET